MLVRSPSPIGAPVERVAPVADQCEQELLEPLGRVHRQVLETEAVAQQDVEAVDVDAVVGVPVREHDCGQVLDLQVLLEMAERAVAAVDPHGGVFVRTR